MEISIASDVTHQPSSTSPKRREPPVGTATTSYADPVLDQFQQMRSMISTFPGERQDPLQVHDSHSATVSTMLSSFSVKYSRRPKNARDKSPQVNRPPHFNFHKLHRPQEDVNTYLSRNSDSFHSTCTADTDFHWRTCYSDCKSSSTATTKAFIFITVDTACYVLRSCGWPTAWVFQTDDLKPPFSCTFTIGGKSAQHFRIIQSLCGYSKCSPVSADRHTTAIFTLSTSTSTITSAIYYSSRTVKTSQPVQPAVSQPKSAD